jgi:hypothetical protein
VLNAVKVVGKDIAKIKVVVNGLGAAGTACCKILRAAGVQTLIGCDRQGAVLDASGDVFIGTSVGNLLTAAPLSDNGYQMAARRIDCMTPPTHQRRCHRTRSCNSTRLRARKLISTPMFS